MLQRKRYRLWAMKHNNISIFVTHVGCPHMCAFCNQHTITGNSQIPHAQDVRRICSKALDQIKDPENTEIAFFGGSFTAVPRNYMIELLEAANTFLGEGKFKGIRISTRPDYIDDEVLETLKRYGVTSIEIGAQSINDKVLDANERGHSTLDIVNACKLIKEHNFELGLQLMVGLYRSDMDIELENMEKVLEIKPDTVRIYPVVVLKGTKLAQLFKAGKYHLISMDDVIDLCSKMLYEFENAGIKVLKCGLHASEFVERDMVAGYYHPAFRELCESRIIRENMSNAFRKSGIPIAENAQGQRYHVTCAVSPRCISAAIGHKKANSEHFLKNGINIKVVGDEKLFKYEVEVRDVRVCI